MQNLPTVPRTSCNGHRTEGYALVAGLWTCRKCGLPQSHHITVDETEARQIGERAVSEWIATP